MEIDRERNRLIFSRQNDDDWHVFAAARRGLAIQEYFLDGLSDHGVIMKVILDECQFYNGDDTVISLTVHDASVLLDGIYTTMSHREAFPKPANGTRPAILSLRDTKIQPSVVAKLTPQIVEFAKEAA